MANKLPLMTDLPPLPVSQQDEKRILKQAEINVDLWAEAQKERDRQKLTTREIFEYGLRCFIAASRAKK
jgi:hypothetical protein